MPRGVLRLLEIDRASPVAWSCACGSGGPTPYATFATPPRHVRTMDDLHGLHGLTHWTSASLPW